MQDRDRVAAIRAGEPRGLASTYEEYASALYTFCRSMLRDEHAAQDAVHDTFVILDQRVGQLRDPDRLRPWLYAVARSQCLRQLRAAGRWIPTDDLGDVMDHSADAGADLESAQLQTLVWDALGGLNPGERAALEMSLRHGLSGIDLADALGVSQASAKKLVQRGKSDLEKSVAALLLARAPSDCAVLDELIAGWDGQLDPLMRKRLTRHIEQCMTCGDRKRREVNAAALFAVIPLLAVPVALTTRIQNLRLVSDDTPLAGSTPSLPSATLSNREREVIARSAGLFDRAGFPTARRRPGQGVGTIFAAAAAIAIAVLLISAVRAHHPSTPANLFAIEATSTSQPAPGASALATSVTPPDPTARSRVETTPARQTSRPVLSPTDPVVQNPPTVTSRHTEPTSPSTTPLLTPGTLSLSSPTLDLGAKASGSVQLAVTGNPVTWFAAAEPGISVKPTTGTVVTTELVTITIDRTMFPKAGNSIITFSWTTGKVALDVTWADGS